MEIKPIKNEKDYQEALKEIDGLMDARPNTPEDDRLEVLVTLVEAWEKKHWPIELPVRVSLEEQSQEQPFVSPLVTTHRRRLGGGI